MRTTLRWSALAVVLATVVLAGAPRSVTRGVAGAEGPLVHAIFFHSPT